MNLHTIRKCIISLGLVLLTTGAVLAQQDLTIRNYYLPSGVRAYRIKPHQGKIWLGTYDGAYSFDGDTLEHFDINSGLAIDTVFEIETDTQDRLWFYGRTGITTRENNTFSIFNSDLHSNTDYTLDRTDDALWLGIGNSISKINESTVTYPTETRHYISIEKDNDGVYWALGSNALYKLQGNTWMVDTLITYPVAMHIDKKGDMWLSSLYTTLLRRADDEYFHEVEVPGFNNYNVSRIVSDQNGVVYFGTVKQGLVIKDGDVWSIVNTSKGLLDDRVTDMDIDAEGNIWMLHTDIYVGYPDLVRPSGISMILKKEWQTGPRVHGRIYADKNRNGKRDDDEMGIPNQFIKLMPSESYAITDPNGNFSFTPANGANSLTAQLSGFWKEATTPLTYTFTYSGTETIQPFEIGYAWVDVMNINMSVGASITRPGFSATQYLFVSNDGSLPAHVKLTYTYDNRLTYTSSQISPDSKIDNRMTWDFGVLKPRQTASTYVQFMLPANVPLGTVLISTAYLDSSLYSLNTGNNRDTVSVTVIGSYDPNDKQVDQGRGNEHYTLMNTRLKYRIRFQNTGTYEAVNVKIKDELDANLDITSLRIESSSHPMTYRLDDRLLTFAFNNIMLPDSTHNEPASHGYVQYSISPKAGLAENTIVRNMANIYFDFNEPVVTNEVFNTYVTKYPGAGNPGSGGPVTGIEPPRNNAVVYPNPSADGTIQIVLPQSESVQSGELIAASGNRLIQFATVPADGRIVLNNIPPGLYLLRLQQGGTVAVTKVIVTR